MGDVCVLIFLDGFESFPLKSVSRLLFWYRYYWISVSNSKVIHLALSTTFATPRLICLLSSSCLVTSRQIWYLKLPIFVLNLWFNFTVRTFKFLSCCNCLSTSYCVVLRVRDGRNNFVLCLNLFLTLLLLYRLKGHSY